MTQIQIVSLILITITFGKITGIQDIANKQSNDLVLTLQENLSFLENMVLDLVKVTDDMVKANKDLKDELNHLKQTIENPIVFTALKTSGIHDVGSYLNSYDKFLTCQGSAFNLDTGVFTAPRSGIFEFSATTQYDQDNRYYITQISVEKNFMKELEFYAYTSDKHDEDVLSFTWMMELQHGENISLKVTAGRFACYEYRNCMFSGKFIRDIWQP